MKKRVTPKAMKLRGIELKLLLIKRRKGQENRDKAASLRKLEILVSKKKHLSFKITEGAFVRCESITRAPQGISGL